MKKNGHVFKEFTVWFSETGNCNSAWKTGREDDLDSSPVGRGKGDLKPFQGILERLTEWVLLHLRFEG